MANPVPNCPVPRRGTHLTAAIDDDWCGGSAPDPGWCGGVSRPREWCDSVPAVPGGPADAVSLLAHVLGLRRRPRS